MGLRGDITGRLTYEHQLWHRHGTSQARQTADLAEANFMRLTAHVDDRTLAGTLEVHLTPGDDPSDELVERAEINDILVEPEFQRMGAATALLHEAERICHGAHLHHSTDMKDDGLAWAMAVDPDERDEAWQQANRERIAERFDEAGKLRPELDRHRTRPILGACDLPSAPNPAAAPVARHPHEMQ